MYIRCRQDGRIGLLMKDISIVKVVVDIGAGWGREALRGIAGYAHRHGPWKIEPVAPWINPTRLARACQNCSGVLAVVTHPAITDTLIQTGLPVVSMNHPDDRLPSVYQSDAAIGRCIVGYFADRGFSNLAYCSWSGGTKRADRERGFLGAVEERKLNGLIFRKRSQGRLPRGSSQQLMKDLAGWVEALPKPVGIMVENDRVGFDLLSVCYQARIGVPGQVAVVGVDNDDVWCDMAWPPLSSLAVPSREIGHRAAEMLDQLMRSEVLEENHVTVPPLHIVTRQSSDYYAVEDQLVAQALVFIRDHVGDRVTADDVAEYCAVSRRTLEYRFRDATQHSPWQHILDAQIDLAQKLLTETDLSIPDIAKASGFGSSRSLLSTFRKKVGQTPNGYRGQCRQSVPAQKLG